MLAPAADRMELCTCSAQCTALRLQTQLRQKTFIATEGQPHTHTSTEKIKCKVPLQLIEPVSGVVSSSHSFPLCSFSLRISFIQHVPDWPPHSRQSMSWRVVCLGCSPFRAWPRQVRLRLSVTFSLAKTGQIPNHLFLDSIVDLAVVSSNVSSNSCAVQLALFPEILSGSPICVTWTGLHHSCIYAIQVGLTYLFLPVTHFSAQEAWDDGPRNALRQCMKLGESVIQIWFYVSANGL